MECASSLLLRSPSAADSSSRLSSTKWRAKPLSALELTAIDNTQKNAPVFDGVNHKSLPLVCVCVHRAREARYMIFPRFHYF